MSGDLEIRPLLAEHDEARDELLRSARAGSVFHESVWRDVVSEVLGAIPREIGAWRGARLVGVLPVMRTRNLPTGCNWLSIPYAVYGGPVAAPDDDVDADAVSRALLTEAERAARADGAKRLELRTIEPVAGTEEWAESTLYSTFVRDLPEKPDEVLAQMPKKARAEARKARKKHGLELVEGRWYVEDLYRLFLANKRSLGSPALPPKLFRTLMQALGDRVHVHLVHKDREPASAVMSFADGDTLIAYYSGTAPGADRSVSASNFMYMALQEWAVENGFRRFDFGRSRGDSGAHRFKEHQGFEPTTMHYRYRLFGKAELPSFTPSNPRTKVLRETWAKLPLFVVERLSPTLSRYLA